MKSPCKSSKITPHDYNSRFVDDINKQNKTKQKKAVTQNTSTTCKYQQKATREVKQEYGILVFLFMEEFV